MVIGDKKVAKNYLLLCKKIDLGINLSKSILSYKGDGCEFAKRTIYKRIDVSPVSYKEFIMASMNAKLLSDLAIKYNINVSSFLSMLGVGYKAKSLYLKDWIFLIKNNHKRLADRLFIYKYSLDKTHNLDLAVQSSSFKENYNFELSQVVLHPMNIPSMYSGIPAIQENYYNDPTLIPSFGAISDHLIDVIKSYDKAIKGKGIHGYLDDFSIKFLSQEIDIPEKDLKDYLGSSYTYIIDVLASHFITFIKDNRSVAKTLLDSIYDRNQSSLTLNFLLNLQKKVHTLPDINNILKENDILVNSEIIQALVI